MANPNKRLSLFKGVPNNICQYDLSNWDVRHIQVKNVFCTTVAMNDFPPSHVIVGNTEVWEFYIPKFAEGKVRAAQITWNRTTKVLTVASLVTGEVDALIEATVPASSTDDLVLLSEEEITTRIYESFNELVGKADLRRPKAAYELTETMFARFEELDLRFSVTIERGQCALLHVSRPWLSAMSAKLIPDETTAQAEPANGDQNV